MTRYSSWWPVFGAAAAALTLAFAAQTWVIVGNPCRVCLDAYPAWLCAAMCWAAAVAR